MYALILLTAMQAAPQADTVVQRLTMELPFVHIVQGDTTAIDLSLTVNLLGPIPVVEIDSLEAGAERAEQSFARSVGVHVADNLKWYALAGAALWGVYEFRQWRKAWAPDSWVIEGDEGDETTVIVRPFWPPWGKPDYPRKPHG